MADASQHTYREFYELADLSLAVRHAGRRSAPLSASHVEMDAPEWHGEGPVRSSREPGGDGWELNPPGTAQHRRDADRFDRPDDLVLDRQSNPHVAFGHGIHRCLGAHFARMQLAIAFDELLARATNFRLKDGSTSLAWPANRWAAQPGCT